MTKTKKKAKKSERNVRVGRALNKKQNSSHKHDNSELKESPCRRGDLVHYSIHIWDIKETKG